MLRIFWNSRSAMMANQEKLDAISNNLANANTDGYKKVSVSFQDLVSETLKRNGYPTSAGSGNTSNQFTGTGVKSTAWIQDNTQGTLKETQKTTDFAIDGDGYFQATRADGSIAYTRVGHFDTDAENHLVDSNGSRVTILYNPGINGDSIKYTKDNFTVSERGEIMIKDGDGYKSVGRLPIYTADGADAFRSVGENYYTPSQGTNVYEVNNPSMYQGYIEGSNVDMVSEMTDMMVTQRAFEFSSKAMKTADDMWGMANNLRSK
ncbi:MAG: flagellar hook-basal body complex protein [Bacillota bacterium]|nr:flagellar hook-basal body complex protein [Bacillota bacterium]